MFSSKLMLVGLLVAMAIVQAKEAPADGAAKGATPPKTGEETPPTKGSEGKEGEKAAEGEKKKDEPEPPVIYASIESIRIKKLDTLPEVQTFIKEDLAGYRRSKYIKKEDSKTPELVILDKDKKEVERLDIGAMNRTQINDLFIAKGLFKRDEEELEDDEEWEGDRYDDDDDDYYRDEL